MIILNGGEYMKKLTFIIRLFFIGLASVGLLYFCNSNSVKVDEYSCDEAGVCPEGIKYTIEHDTFIINKETCLQHNKQWKEDIKACYMY